MWRGVRAGRPLLALGLALTITGAILLFAPGRTAVAHHLCAATGSPFGPFDVQTYEHADYRNAYARTLELAAYNQLFPDIPSFALPRLETGDRAAGSSQTVDPYIPPVLLKAIAWVESGWAQGSYSPLVQYGEVGPTLVSHDCGYGIMQVTTGMQNVSGVPNLDQAMIAGHYAFNIARGARILADKWNQATELRPIVGNRDPRIIENWYFALWGYNGFALQNHPLAGDNTWPRPPYDCREGTDKSPYPYQELVLGCVMNPPVRGGVPLWNPQPVHIPDWSDPAFAGPMSLENWAACSSGNCAAMDIPTPNTSNSDPTVPLFERTAVLGLPSLAVSRDQVLFTPTIPGSLASVNVQVSNPGSGVLAFRVTAGASWLRLSRTQGVALGADLGGRGVTVGITADTSGLTPGFYSAVVRFESLYASGAPRTLTVSMTYRPPGQHPDGTLLKGDGPAIYLLAGGVRRHIPDPATFLARGFSPAAVVTLSGEELGAYREGRSLPSILADGTLVKGSGAEIWVMAGGARRHVPSPEAFIACGYGPDAVLNVSNEVVAAVPDGGVLTGACPRLTPYEGALVRGSGPEIFVMRGGLKRHIPNPLTMELLGAVFAESDQYAESTLNGIPTGRQLLDMASSGFLYQGSGPELWVTEGGTRRHVLSPDVMASCGYTWEAVRRVTDSTIGLLPVGQPLGGGPCPSLAPPNGALLKGSGPAVYVVQDRQRRHVLSPGVLEACRYQWGDVDVVPDAIVAMIPEAAPLGGPPCP